MAAKFDFSPSEAAFVGYRWIMHRPARALLILVGFALASTAVNVLIFKLAGPVLADLQLAARAQDQAAMRAIIFHSGGGLWILFGYLLGLAPFVWTAAASLRAMLLHTSPLRWGFGRTELTLYGLTLALILLSEALILGLTIGAARFGGGSALAGLGLSLVLTLWLSIRLSLLYPAAVERHAKGVIEAFGLTAGRFWKIFGAWILWLFVQIALALLGVLVGALAALPFVGFQGLGTVINPPVGDLAAAAHLPHLIYLFFQAMIAGAGIVAGAGMLAHVYLAATGRDPETGEPIAGAA